MGVIAILTEAFKALQPLVPIGAVRRDTAANTGEANGTFGLLTLDSAGRLRVLATAGSGASELGKAEDSAAVSGDVGVAVLVVRRDTTGSGVDADGDYGSPNMDANGRVRVIDDSLPAPYIDHVASADTSAHAFGSQAVKTPVTIVVDPTTTGTVTIDDGVAGGVKLDAVNRSGVFFCSNLSQLRYTFSVNAGTEGFGLSCGT